MKSNKLINVKNPVDSQDCATKDYVDAQTGLKVNKMGDEMFGKLDMNFNTISNVKFPVSSLDAINKIYLQVTMKPHEISLENLVKIANVVSVVIGRNPDLQKYVDYFNRMYTLVTRLSAVFNEVFEGKDIVNEIADFTYIKDLQVVIIAVIEELYDYDEFIDLKNNLMNEKLVLTPEKGTVRRRYRKFVNGIGPKMRNTNIRELLIQKNLLLIDLGFICLSEDIMAELAY